MTESIFPGWFLFSCCFRWFRFRIRIKRHYREAHRIFFFMPVSVCALLFFYGQWQCSNGCTIQDSLVMMKNSICWNYMPFKYIFLFALGTTVALLECFFCVCLFVCLNHLIFFYEQWIPNTPTQTNHSCCNSTEISFFASFFLALIIITKS